MILFNTAVKVDLLLPPLVVGRTNETDKEWVIFIILVLASLVFIKKSDSIDFYAFRVSTFDIKFICSLMDTYE